MATTSDTAAQTARGNGVNKLFTSKDLTPAQRRLRWVIIGIWVILAYGAVCVLVGSAPWTIWRLYGGLAALGVPLLVLVFWFPVVWAPGPAAGPGPAAHGCRGQALRTLRRPPRRWRWGFCSIRGWLSACRRRVVVLMTPFPPFVWWQSERGFG